VIGLSIEQLDDVAVATLRGDIDAANARRVQEELAGCMDSGATRLVLDLSHTSYVDSAGCDMLLRFSERLRQRRRMLLLVIPPASQLVRLAELVGLPQAIPVHGTLADALGVGPPARVSPASGRSPSET
jgi:anti-anti-sigma factor